MDIFRRMFSLIIIFGFLCSATADEKSVYTKPSEIFPTLEFPGIIPPLENTQRPKLCARWFNNGRVLERPESNTFINVDYAGTADLRTPFAILLVEGMRSLVDGGGLRRATAKPFLQTLISRTDLHESTLGDTTERIIQTLVANSDITNLTDQVFDSHYIRKRLVATLHYLYTQRYAKQGVERRGNLGKYQRQDVRWARRTTRFTQMVNDEVISHIQAQHSVSPRQKLNFEEVFDTSGIVTRARGELVFEVGRFELTKQKDLSNETLLRMGQLGLDRDLVFYKALQKVVTWLNRDVHAQRVFYYVTESMQKVLEDAIPPMKEVKTHAVRQKKKNAKQEVLYECTRDDLIKIEDFLMGKIVEHSFMMDFPSLKAATDKDTVTWNWLFWPNEWPAVQRLRVVDISFYQKTYDIFREAFSSYLKYRQENDMRVLWSQFVNSDGNIFNKFKESLLISVDWIHVQKLANDLGIFEVERGGELVESSVEVRQELKDKEQFN